MTGATQWWGTLVVAFLGLAGVCWTQYWAGRRADQRARNERAERDRDRRLDLYRDLVITFDDVQRVLRTA
ncbi:MAG TPA: hypothetical protein VG317_15385, partial [Pseudonocardiaceae bacterium]|nr:hypothetical protein [Pseudonocardiaceae bacterium]